jgi:hypothetical protein
MITSPTGKGSQIMLPAMKKAAVNVTAAESDRS